MILDSCENIECVFIEVVCQLFNDDVFSYFESETLLFTLNFLVHTAFLFSTSGLVLMGRRTSLLKDCISGRGGVGCDRREWKPPGQ